MENKKSKTYCDKCHRIFIGCKCQKTIEEYSKMPKVEINGKEYVDRDIFIGYALHLLYKERINTTEEIRLGIDLAVSILGNLM